MSDSLTFAQLSISLVEVMITHHRSPLPASIMDHPAWDIVQDCWALAAGYPTLSGKTEEEVRVEANEELRYYNSLKTQ